MSNPQPTPSTTQTTPPQPQDDEPALMRDDIFAPAPPKATFKLRMNITFGGKHPPSSVDHDDVMID